MCLHLQGGACRHSAAAAAAAPAGTVPCASHAQPAYWAPCVSHPSALLDMSQLMTSESNLATIAGLARQDPMTGEQHGRVAVCRPAVLPLDAEQRGMQAGANWTASAR